MSSRFQRPSGALAVLILAAACAGPGATPRPSSVASVTPSSAAAGTPSGAATTAPSGAGASGEIFVTGSSTVAPISLAVAEDFKLQNSNFGYTVEGPGTGDGFALFCAGEADVADASRAIKDTEAQSCTDAGIEFTELRIAYDGITVMTHPDTPIDCLTTADLYALFGPESDSVANWQDAQALATELGSTTQFPELALQITAPGEESGTYDAFVELADITSTAVERSREEGVLRLPGPGYTASPNDSVIVEGVEAGAGSLGFVGFAYFEHAGDAVKAIAIDAGEGCIDPTIETIADGSYPLGRPLFIYPNNQKASDNDALAAWVDFYLSDVGIQNVVDEGYVALPSDELRATRQVWAER